MQGTILVATKEGVVEKDVEPTFFETISYTEKTNGAPTAAHYSK